MLCHSAKPNESVILHAILPVRVKTKGNTKSVINYALYDNGSGGCFLTENLREQLGVNGERTELQLGTMHGQSLVTTTVVCNLVVTDMGDKYPIEIPQSFTRMEIHITGQQIPTPEIMEQWEHLRGTAKKDAQVHTKLGDWVANQKQLSCSIGTSRSSTQRQCRALCNAIAPRLDPDWTFASKGHSKSQ